MVVVVVVVVVVRCQIHRFICHTPATTSKPNLHLNVPIGWLRVIYRTGTVHHFVILYIWMVRRQYGEIRKIMRTAEPFTEFSEFFTK